MHRIKKEPQSLFSDRKKCEFILAIPPDGPRIDSRWCHWGFFSMVPSDKTMCPEVDSVSENEYQGFLLG